MFAAAESVFTCRKGHPLTEANTSYVLQRGKRYRRCRQCHREKVREWNRRKVESGMPAGCQVEGCNQPGRLVRGFCHKHHEHWRKHGTPVPVPVIREHGTVAGYWQHYRRDEQICEPCRKAQQTYSRTLEPRDPRRHAELIKQRSVARYAADPTGVRQQMKESALTQQRQTADVAHRNKSEWTGPELELLLTRDDLSNRELALMLGRTYYAVCRRRSIVRIEAGRLG